MKLTMNDDRSRVSIRVRVTDWHHASRGLAVSLKLERFMVLGYAADRGSIERHHKGARCNLSMTWKRTLRGHTRGATADEVESAGADWVEHLERAGVEVLG